jgi:hypothetical protein
MTYIICLNNKYYFTKRTNRKPLICITLQEKSSIYDSLTVIHSQVPFCTCRCIIVTTELQCYIQVQKIPHHNVTKFCRYFKDASWLLQFLLITVLTFTAHYHVATTYSTLWHKMLRACLSARTAVYCGTVLVYRQLQFSISTANWKLLATKMYETQMTSAFPV